MVNNLCHPTPAKVHRENRDTNEAAQRPLFPGFLAALFFSDKSGVFTEPLRNQCTYKGLLLSANYSLLCMEFTITATTERCPLMTEGGERGKSLLPKVAFDIVAQTKGRLN